MVIREITSKDVEKVAKLIQAIDNTSEYMLWEPGERNVKPEMLEGIIADTNAALFVAEEENKLVGYTLAVGGKAKRNRHSVYLVIGILPECRGKGIGTKLLQAAEKWARNRRIHRLELTVVTENIGALHLYQKLGFTIEGTKKDSLYVNEKYVDEYYMAKLLN